MTKEVGTLAEIGAKPGDVVADALGWKANVVMHDRRICVIYDHWDEPEERNRYDQYRIVSRASDAPKLWRDMTPEEKGALLLAHHEGKAIEYFSHIDHEWGRISEPDWQYNYAYRIKPEPKVETVTTHGTWCNKGKMPKTQYVYEITFNLIDGKPDWNTAKVAGK